MALITALEACELGALSGRVIGEGGGGDFQLFMDIKRGVSILGRSIRKNRKGLKKKEVKKHLADEEGKGEEGEKKGL